MKDILLEDVSMAMDTTLFQSGLIKSYPANYERDQHILSGTSTSVRMKGNVVLCDDGSFTFAPTNSSNTPRYQTIYTTKHGFVRETKEDLIMTIKLPKRLGKWKICALHYQVTLVLHQFLKNLKW